MSQFAGRVGLWSHSLQLPLLLWPVVTAGSVTLWKSRHVWDQPLWMSRHVTACLQRPGHLLTDGSWLDKVLPVVSPHVCCHPSKLHPAVMLGSGFSKASCPSTQKALVISLQQVPLSRPRVFSYPSSMQNESQSHCMELFSSSVHNKFLCPLLNSFLLFCSH